ncbi:MAG: hypothetical protein QOG91_709 [Candidatus Parcubacteria bacterium]|jgi:hypothetical protein|nr:hypothetical protein [Candidatus Parcubacteria bacterium]
MSLESYLEKVRAKPEHVKKHISFWTSFGVTAVIFTFWVGSFGVFRNAAAGDVATTVRNAATPGQSLVAGVGSCVVDVKELIFGAKKVTYSSVEVLPGNK